MYYDDAQAKAQRAARGELEKALHAYYDKVDPEAFIDGWVIVAQKRRSDWEKENQTGVGMTVATGQSWVLTRGLLEIAIDVEQGRH